MFDVAPSEMLVVAVVAIVFIGPKDLPRAMHIAGQWVGRGRALARQFRGAIDEMVREAELAEMEKKWQAENERIMREHATLLDHDPPPPVALPEPVVADADARPAALTEFESHDPDMPRDADRDDRAGLDAGFEPHGATPRRDG